MKKYLILLVPLLFLMAQCKKDNSYLGDHTIAEGIITEKGSGKPVKNVQMRLRRCTYQVLGSSSCETIDTLRTDTKGFFKFDFQHEKDYQYEIRAVPDTEKYYVVDNDAPLEKGRYNSKINLLLTPYSWIKLRIRNINPVNQWDTIRIFNSSAKRGEYLGGIVDVTDKYRVHSTVKEYIGWRVSKNGQVTFKEIFLDCIPHDTIFYDINY